MCLKLLIRKKYMATIKQEADRTLDRRLDRFLDFKLLKTLLITKCMATDPSLFEILQIWKTCTAFIRQVNIRGKVGSPLFQMVCVLDAQPWNINGEV